MQLTICVRRGDDQYSVLASPPGASATVAHQQLRVLPQTVVVYLEPSAAQQQQFRGDVA